MTTQIKMQPDDPEMRAILGVPEKKVHNPFYEATEMDRLGHRKEAERIYIELMNHDFDNPVLMAALGMNYATVEKNGLAHLLLTAAIARADNMLDGFKRLGILPRNPTYEATEDFLKIKKSEILNAIGTCWKHENKVKQAREYFERAQADIPLNPDIQNNLATLFINEGHPERAMTHLEAALKVQPDHPQAHWNRSLVHLELGDYEKGWEEYQYGIPAGVRQDRNHTKDPVPHWDGTPGKKLIVYGEQGIGDEIMFASVLPDLLRDCPDVVFECHKKLHRLFANSFPGLKIYPTREDEILTWPIKQPEGTPRYHFDAKAALGNVPKYYRPNLASFPGTPYIKPTAASELRWNEELARLGPGPKIGISWIGGHKKTRVEVRSIPLEALLPILQQKGAHFISLQYTPCEPEIADFKAKHGIQVHHWPEAVQSPEYDDTAGLVANLDLVITVCTSVVHLAGAMGVPTWVLTPSRPAWRYRLDLDTMPWYGNTVSLFRQAPDTLDWAPVIEEVAGNLADMLAPLNANTGT